MIGPGSDGDAIARHVLDRSVRAFDDNCFGGTVDADNWKWAVSDWGELVAHFAVTLAFGSEVGVITGLDCFRGSA